jgi:hypothetical protein
MPGSLIMPASLIMPGSPREPVAPEMATGVAPGTDCGPSHQLVIQNDPVGVGAPLTTTSTRCSPG